MFSHYFFSSLIAFCASFLPQNTNPNKVFLPEKNPPHTVIAVKAEGERYPLMVTDTVQTVEFRGLEIGQEYEFFFGKSRNLPDGKMLFQGKDITSPNFFKAKNTSETFIIKVDLPRNQRFNEIYYLSYSNKDYINPPTVANASSRSPLSVITTTNGTTATNIIKNTLIGTDCFEITNAVVLGGTNRWGTLDRKSTRLNSSHPSISRMPSSA